MSWNCEVPLKDLLTIQFSSSPEPELIDLSDTIQLRHLLAKQKDASFSKHFWDSPNTLHVEVSQKTIVLGRHSHSFQLNIHNPTLKETFSVYIKKVVPKELQKAQPNTTQDAWKRNIRSYQVELYFYKVLSPLMSDFLPLTYLAKADVASDLMNSAFFVIAQDLSHWRQELYLSVPQAKLCIQNLIVLHSKFWENKSHTRKLWEVGSWWTLEKRGEQEISILDESWKKFCANFPEATSNLEPKMKDLGNRLAGSAKWISSQLRHTDDLRKRTLVHGDCKTANIFLSPDNSAVKFIDFQWSGFGLPQLDLMYLLTSSLKTETLKSAEEMLLKYYIDAFARQSPSSFLWDYEEFLRLYKLVFLDYMRCAIASFYPTLTASVFQKNCTVLGRVGHNRSFEHAFYLAEKASLYLQEFEQLN